jgi:hypothetical protein
MKTVLALILLLLTCAADAQSTNAPQPRAGSTNNPATGAVPNGLNLGAGTTISRFNLEVPAAKPNEVVKGNVTLSGSTVEAVKTKRPLQLLNPVAPAQYGSPEDNVARDPINGKTTGLKIFAIKF